MTAVNEYGFYEFFAGGGMVRAGLADGWTCLFANDFDIKKGEAYRANWGSEALKTDDIRNLSIDELPECASLAWASFPCQDLSLAGGGAGLAGDRSGTFWPFWNLMEGLVADGRPPSIIALENVCGTLTSHGGQDFATICDAFDRLGYRVGPLVIDAALFVPQSRSRLFIIGVPKDVDVPEGLVGEPSRNWHPNTLLRAYGGLPTQVKSAWVWWRMPLPKPRGTRFADLVEDHPSSVNWHSTSETTRLLQMMNGLHLAKVEEAKRAGRRMVGTVYKRTRRDKEGHKVQRAEVRFDDVAGCLRTPAGGSSRQLLLVVDGDDVRSRLISSRETARLMGLPEDYELPSNYNEAYHLTGDGVVVPIVKHLAEHLLGPLANASASGIEHDIQAIA